MHKSLLGALSLLAAIGLVSACSSLTATSREVGTHAPARSDAGSRTGAATRPRVTLPAATTRYHYIANVKAPRAVARLGYNVIDTGSSDGQIDALPAGTRAMVWLGEKCPTRIDGTFRDIIDRLATNPKVYGYFLSDEPHISDCALGPANLAEKARYIHQASAGRQKTFIVLSWTVPSGYHAFRPAASGVDLVGIDPYPCSIDSPECSYAKVVTRVHQAIQAGIPPRRIVPSFQAFGQENMSGHEGSYYNLPTGYQMKRLLSLWAQLVPHPRLDFTYGWDHQEDSSNPTLVDSAVLQRILFRYMHG